MTDEIRKQPMKTGDVGRPKEVKVHGSSADLARTEPEILGAAPRHGQVRILDRTSGDASPPPEIHAHEEITVEDEGRLRSTPKEHPEVEIQVRAADQVRWERVKRVEDDDES